MAEAFMKPPVRFLGYGYGYNEAFRYNVDYERTLLTVANVFIFGHIFFKALAAKDMNGAAFEVLDTLVFHLIATVAIPILLARLIWSLGHEIMHNVNASQRFHCWVPVIATVAVLILASKPIDYMVNELLDESLRKLLK